MHGRALVYTHRRRPNMRMRGLASDSVVGSSLRPNLQTQRGAMEGTATPTPLATCRCTPTASPAPCWSPCTTHAGSRAVGATPGHVQAPRMSSTGRCKAGRGLPSAAQGEGLSHSDRVPVTAHHLPATTEMAVGDGACVCGGGSGGARAGCTHNTAAAGRGTAAGGTGSGAHSLEAGRRRHQARVCGPGCAQQHTHKQRCKVRGGVHTCKRSLSPHFKRRTSAISVNVPTRRGGGVTPLQRQPRRSRTRRRLKLHAHGTTSRRSHGGNTGGTRQRDQRAWEHQEGSREAPTPMPPPPMPSLRFGRPARGGKRKRSPHNPSPRAQHHDLTRRPPTPPCFLPLVVTRCVGLPRGACGSCLCFGSPWRVCWEQWLEWVARCPLPVHA